MSAEGVPTSREEIYEALFDFAQTIRWQGHNGQTAFLTTSRRVKHFSDVSLQPALFQGEHTEIVQQTASLEYKRTFKAAWYIYHQVGNNAPQQVPATESNAIIDAIFAAFQTNGPEVLQTLGGIVHHAWIDGTIEKFNGDMEGQTVLVVPISLQIP